MNHSVHTGLGTGHFHRLSLLNSNGEFQALSSMTTAAGGGLTTLSETGGSITKRGSGSTRNLIVDLSQFATTSQIDDAIVAALTNYVTSTSFTMTPGNYASCGAFNTLLANYVLAWPLLTTLALLRSKP